MTERIDCDVLVIGAGSGAAIARRLALRGQRVLIMRRDDAAPASVRNHRIKHSGAMQERLDTARELWEAFRWMDPIERAHLREPKAVISLPAADVDLATDRWRAAGIPFSPASEVDGAGCAWGPEQRQFLTPDRPVDYAAVVRKALGSAVAAGARVLSVRSTRIEASGGALRGVRIHTARGPRTVRARWCVLAAGAWAPDLLAEIGVDLGLSRWRSHMLEIPSRVVTRLTIRLGPALLVATPFGRSTLVGDARRVPVQVDGDSMVDPQAAELLRRDAGAFLPGVRADTLEAAAVTVGVKTEPPGHGSLGQGTALVGPEGHGVAGLLVALPGKASLMFALADRVAGRLETSGAPSRVRDRVGAGAIAGGPDRTTW